jgi:hypothetical protein
VGGPTESPDEVSVPQPGKYGPWFPSRENAVIYWPRMPELLIEELDV